MRAKDVLDFIGITGLILVVIWVVNRIWPLTSSGSPSPLSGLNLVNPVQSIGSIMSANSTSFLPDVTSYNDAGAGQPYNSYQQQQADWNNALLSGLANTPPLF